MRILLLAPLLLLTAAAPGDERNFMVSGFDRLRVDGPFEVEVVAGSPGALAFGDRGALDQVTVRVDSGTMVVSAGPLNWDARKAATGARPTVRVSVPALRAVVLNGAAKVRVAAMRGRRVDLVVTGSGSLDVAAVTAEDLDVGLTGTGAVTLAGTAARARLRNYGVGSIDAAGLVAGDANVVAQSGGNIRVTARYTARASAMGSGAIEILGKPECKLSGSGPITCAGTVRAD